jgi:VWFA-related protein
MSAMAHLRAAATLVAFLSGAGVAGAQQPEPSIRTNVSVVLVPVTVTDARGRFVDGLGPSDFAVYDGGQRRPAELEYSESFAPISVAIVVQTTAASGAALLKLNKIGSLIQPLVTGERGAAAVIAFDHEIRVVQDFTSEPGAITNAFRSITPSQESAARTLDAVAEAARMLAARPPSVRKIMLLISESRDRGSETDLAETLRIAAKDGIVVYPVVFSIHKSPWTVKPGELPPDPAGFNLIAGIVELARLGKTNSSDALARATGGRTLSFNTLRGLENAIATFGEELHSQYLLSFYPVPAASGAYREIRVEIPERPYLVIRARPGYIAAP